MPARASVVASPNETVVFPCRPSGLVTTTDLKPFSENWRFVRRSRIDSAMIRNSVLAESSSGELSFGTLRSSGISP